MASGSTHHKAENLLISSCGAVAIAIVSYVSNVLLPKIRTILANSQDKSFLN